MIHLPKPKAGLQEADKLKWLRFVHQLVRRKDAIMKNLLMSDEKIFNADESTRGGVWPTNTKMIWSN